MTNNSQKTPFSRTINKFAEQKVLDAIQTLGQALPCHVVAVSGSIVTVKFDIVSVNPSQQLTLPDVTCPMFGPEYVRYPTQINDKGVVMSADYYIGGVSDLGVGNASLVIQANLSALIWFPIASKKWSETDNPDAVVIYGPDGAVIRTVDKNTTLTIKKDGVLLNTDKAVAVTAQEQSTIQADGETLTLGSGSIRTSGVLKAGNGATGTILTASVQTIQVHDGIITSIS